MERIKQALELARLERKKTGSHSSGSRTSSTAGLKNGVANQKIEYTQTKNIPLSSHELRQKRILIDQRNSVSDAYKILRTQLLQRMVDNGWNTLAITSPREGEGKTLTAINLAISMARELDYTVLLVDANLRTPSIHDQLGFYSEYGLTDYLSNDVPLTDIFVHPENIPRFVVLPAGHAVENSSELLSSPKMGQLVEELKSRYPSRFVIFDLPPLLASSDALAFSPYVDASLIVIKEGETKKSDVKQAFELLQSTEVIGTILNNGYTRERDYGDVNLKEGVVSRLINKVVAKFMSDKDKIRPGV